MSHPTPAPAGAAPSPSAVGSPLAAGSPPSVGTSSVGASSAAGGSPEGYAGDVTPAEAWRLAGSGQAVIVDVRTGEEWYWVGRVPGAEHIEWAIGRQQTRNENFLTDLAARVPRDRQVLFLCRSGVRSQAAAKAATSVGYASAWNIVGGFEGPIDDQRQRGKLSGWRAAGLPWEQS